MPTDLAEPVLSTFGVGLFPRGLLNGTSEEQESVDTGRRWITTRAGERLYIHFTLVSALSLALSSGRLGFQSQSAAS